MSMVDHRFTFNARIQIQMHQTVCVFVYKIAGVTKTYIYIYVRIFPCCFFGNKIFCWKLSRMDGLDLDLLLYRFFSLSFRHPAWALRVKQMLLQKQQRQLQQPLTKECKIKQDKFKKGPHQGTRADAKRAVLAAPLAKSSCCL